MNQKKIALFAGSFDPITNGHLDTIERASLLFDELIVAVLTNTSKKSFFSIEQKEYLVKESVSHIPTVKVITCSTDLTIRIARQYGANYLIRGIRNQQDYEYEKNIASLNKKMAPDIETFFLLSDERYQSISSSMVKEIAHFNGDVSLFVPKAVQQAMTEIKKR